MVDWQFAANLLQVRQMTAQITLGQVSHHRVYQWLHTRIAISSTQTAKDKYHQHTDEDRTVALVGFAHKEYRQVPKVSQ
jgi:hypothetical protein